MQGHTKKAITTAAASDTFNATLIYANSGAAALAKYQAKGKTIVTAEETPEVIYHRTTKGNWNRDHQRVFFPGGGDRVSSGRARNYSSEVQATEWNYICGPNGPLRSELPWPKE